MVAAFPSAGKPDFCRVGTTTCDVEPLRGTRGPRPLPGKLALFAVPLVVMLAYATGARAAEDEARRGEAAQAGGAPKNAASENPDHENPAHESTPREATTPPAPT